MLKKYFIGIDIGGTKIYGGLVSPSGEIARTVKIPTPANARASAILAALHQVIKELLKEQGVPLKNVLGLGVAVPGVVDGHGRVVVTPQPTSNTLSQPNNAFLIARRTSMAFGSTPCLKSDQAKLIRLFIFH